MSAADSRLIELVYVSAATKLYADPELVALLRKARDKNSELGITGMLLYVGGNFIQAIEGPAEAVDKLFTAIKADRRHKRVTVIHKGPITSRQFGSWAMGFRKLDSIPEELTGEIGLPEDPAEMFQTPDAGRIALRVLHSFASTMR